MTQEEKQLLLQDLCARLPYKPRVRYYYNSIGCAAINGYSDEGYLSYQNLEDFSIYPKYGLEKTRIYNILPYLRPMSSMTEEEKKELKEATCPEGTGYFDEKYLICPINHYGEHISYEFMSDILTWLNVHHFEYHGLIERGLALEAPEGMYKTDKIACDNCENNQYCSQSEYVKKNCYKL